MTTFRCLIKTPSGQLRWTEVEAINYQDAQAQASATNAGEVISVQTKGSRFEGDLYAKSSSSRGIVRDGDGEAVTGFLAFVAILAVIYIAIIAWPALLAVGALYLAFKLLTA